MHFVIIGGGGGGGDGVQLLGWDIYPHPPPPEFGMTEFRITEFRISVFRKSLSEFQNKPPGIPNCGIQNYGIQNYEIQNYGIQNNTYIIDISRYQNIITFLLNDFPVPSPNIGSYVDSVIMLMVLDENINWFVRL